MPSIERYENTAGRWYRVRYRTPDRRQTSKRGFRTKRDAERFLATVEVAQMRGEWVDPSRSIVDLSVVAEEWFAGQIGIKPTTRSGYRYSLDRHVLPRWGTTPLARATHGDVQRWVNELNAKLRPSTVRQIYLVLAQIFKFAIRDGRITRNPAADIELPRITRERRGYLTHRQVRLLAEQCGEHADVIRFLAYTGLRWGEMAALSIGSVDLGRRRIEIERSVTEVGGTLVWGGPKSHHRRSVPVPELIVDSIISRSSGREPDDILFATPRGDVLRSGNFRHRVFDRAVRRVRELDPSMPRVTPHDLRHTAASLAISAGANVKAVQRMLGHASAAMTLDVYADLFDEDLHTLAKALDAAARASEV